MMLMNKYVLAAALCCALLWIPSAKADYIRGDFTTSLVSTAPDSSCPGSVQTRSTYAGPGSGSLDFENIYMPGGAPYTATITYSYCNGLGSVVTGGLFTVDAGTQGSFGGAFSGNYLMFSGALDELGQYNITSETGLFASVDPTGFFDLGTNIPAQMDGNVFLYTPEPASIAMLAIGVLLLVYGLWASRASSSMLNVGHRTVARPSVISKLPTNG